VERERVAVAVVVVAVAVAALVRDRLLERVVAPVVLVAADEEASARFRLRVSIQELNLQNYIRHRAITRHRIA
jgi:hypothetical protein